MSLSVSKNIFWLTISRIAALVLLAIAYFALFRYLKPYGSGQYQFVLSYVLIFGTIVDFGIQQFITKKISEDPKNAKQYFQEFFSFETVVALSLLLLLVVIAYFKHYEATVFYAIVAAGLGMALNALCYPFMAVLAAFPDIKKVALINFLNSVVNFSMIFLAIFFHRYIVFLAATTVVFGILDLILYRAFVTKHLPRPQVLKAAFSLDFRLIKNIIKQGWPFAVLVGFSAIYNRIDVLIITTLQGYQETGLYTAAYKIFDLLGFFPAAVSFTLFPFFASLIAQKAVSEVKGALEKYLRLMVIAALPMAVGGTILAAKLINLIAGPGYENAAGVLAILIWAPAILFIYIPVNALVISQLTKKAVIITGANVLVNIVGNLILIPIYGIKAAAVMTVVSESIQGIFYFYFVRKNITHFNFFGLFLKPLFAAVAMGLVLWPIRGQQLLVTLPVGATVYFLILMITGFVSKSDLSLVKGLIKSPNS